MKIAGLFKEQQDTLATNLTAAIASSRFLAEVHLIKTTAINILMVRLETPKKYCGSYPNSCPYVDRSWHKHKFHDFLEGADWVEFNDLVNDVCDQLGISARIKTRTCIIRKKFNRRIAYNSSLVGNFYNWDYDADDSCYYDGCYRRSPPSSFPTGTPGIYKNIYNCPS